MPAGIVDTLRKCLMSFTYMFVIFGALIDVFSFLMLVFLLFEYRYIEMNIYILNVTAH